jgi:hypothetical protein
MRQTSPGKGPMAILLKVSRNPILANPAWFETHVEIPRIKVGERQTIEHYSMKKLCCLLNI